MEGNIDDRSIRTQKGIKDGDMTPLTPEEAEAYAKSLPEQSKKRNAMIAADQQKQLLHGEEMSIRARLDIAGIGYKSGANLAELRQLNASHFGGPQPQQGVQGMFPGGIPTFLTIEQQAVLLKHEEEKQKKEKKSGGKKEDPPVTEAPADPAGDDPASEPDPTDNGEGDPKPEAGEGDVKTKIITQDDLDANPELIDQGVKVGDEVELGEEEDASSEATDPPANKNPKTEEPVLSDEVIALQKQFSEKFPKKKITSIAPKWRNNAEWLKGKLAE